MRFFPEVRLSVWHAMVVIAALAVSLGLAREHLTLGTVTGCVLVLTILRTLMIAQRHRREGEEATRGRRVRWFLGSLCCSVAIIGAGCGAFLFVYQLPKLSTDLLIRGLVSHPPPMELYPSGLGLGMLAGLGAGYGVRRWLWEPRNRRCESRNATNPSP